MRVYLVIGLFGFGVLLAPGCRTLRKSSAKTLPPVITAPPVSRTPPREPPTVPPPPKVEGPKVAQLPPPNTEATKIEVPAPPPKPQPQRQAKKARRKTPPGAPAPTEVAVQTAPPAQPPPEQPTAVPQLQQLLSPAQQTAYNKAIDQAVERTRTNLNKVQGRSLDAGQKANLERARAFLSQAEETRGSDLATAKNLAERADVLAEDLARSLR